MGLPVAFIKNMREILGEEGLAEYLDSFEKPKFTGLRVNTSRFLRSAFVLEALASLATRSPV